MTHVHLALQDMLLGLVDPTDAEPDTDTASYWRAARFGWPGRPPTPWPTSPSPADWDDEQAVLVGWDRIPRPGHR